MNRDRKNSTINKNNPNEKYLTLNIDSDNNQNQNNSIRYKNNPNHNMNNHYSNNRENKLFENIQHNNDNEFKNMRNYTNKEYFMNKFKQNEVSFSEMEDSKITESDKLSSYAPSERTKGIYLFIKIFVLDYFKQSPIDVSNNKFNKIQKYNEKDFRNSRKLKENLKTSNSSKGNSNMHNNLYESLQDDTLLENRNMKLNSKITNK
jgi:hypothetical protein